MSWELVLEKQGTYLAQTPHIYSIYEYLNLQHTVSYSSTPSKSKFLNILSMDTLRNATATILGEGTATSLLGPSTTASTTEESQSGLEPISGETGSGTAEEPYDAGNKEDPEVGGAAAQHTDTTTGTSDAAIGSSTGASGSTSSEPASSSDVRESDSTTVGETGGDVVGGAKTNESARDSDESGKTYQHGTYIAITIEDACHEPLKSRNSQLTR